MVPFSVTMLWFPGSKLTFSSPSALRAGLIGFSLPVAWADHWILMFKGVSLCLTGSVKSWIGDCS